MINPYTIGLAAITLMASFGLGYIQGKENGLVQYYEFRSNVETETARLQADAEKARLDSERITADVSNAWSDALDDLRRNPRIVRVQSPASCDPAGLRPLPTAAAGLNATGQELTPGAAADVAVTYAECERIANDAIVDAAMLTHLQHWINEVRNVRHE